MIGETTSSPYSNPVFILLTHYIIKAQLQQQKQRVQHDFTILYILYPSLLVQRCIIYVSKWCYQAHTVLKVASVPLRKISQSLSWCKTIMDHCFLC